MRASVIDLGYNSLKMVSYETRPDDSFRAYDQRGSLTRLGEGLNQTGFLGQEAMERTLRGARAPEGGQPALAGSTASIAIATSPVREAGNGYRFQREAESVLGLKFKVLSGEEEALFSYIGAARATRLSDVLFFDLGGGSLEFTYARGFRVRKTLSLPLGALRMTELYGREGSRYSKKDYDKMRRRTAELLPTRGGARAQRRYGPAGRGRHHPGAGEVRPVDKRVPTQQASQLPAAAEVRSRDEQEAPEDGPREDSGSRRPGQGPGGEHHGGLSGDLDDDEQAEVRRGRGEHPRPQGRGPVRVSPRPGPLLARGVRRGEGQQRSRGLARQARPGPRSSATRSPPRASSPARED